MSRIGGRGVGSRRHIALKGKTMPPTPRSAPAVIASMVVAALTCIATSVHAHGIDCTGRAGIDLARCERHQAMAAQCGPLKGEAHFTCDRAFLLANPLHCKALASDDAKRCQAEVAAFKTCEPQPGREFMRCVRDEVKASPMGAP